MTNGNRAEVTRQLKTVLANASNGRAKVDDLPEEARLIEDVGLASLDLLELRFELETAWNVRITDEEAISMKTARDVIDMVLQKSKTESA
jgi:acyl carrier protein